MRQGVDLLERSIVEWPSWPAFLAEACGTAGRPEEGLEVLARAEGKAGGALRGTILEAELYRIRGDLLLQRSPKNRTEAETLFRRAIEAARRMEARSLELRAAMSLARLWHKQGKKDEARALLTPIYDWFTEGFDTQDLKDAKALLDELA